MDKLSIVCAFTDFGGTWYCHRTDDFLESFRGSLISAFGDKVRSEWDNAFSTNVPYLYGDTFEIKVNPMNDLGHFCVSSPDSGYKNAILTNEIYYPATKDASLVRITMGVPLYTYSQFGEYDDEGLFVSYEYMNNPICLVLEVFNMALRMLGDFNPEAREALIKASKKALIELFGFKEARVEQEFQKAFDKKVVSGKLISTVLDALSTVRS